MSEITKLAEEVLEEDSSIDAFEWRWAAKKLARALVSGRKARSHPDCLRQHALGEQP